MMNSATLTSSMPMLHARLDRDRVDRRGLAREAREGGAGVGEGVMRIPNHATP